MYEPERHSAPLLLRSTIGAGEDKFAVSIAVTAVAKSKAKKQCNGMRTDQIQNKRRGHDVLLLFGYVDAFICIIEVLY